MKMWWGPRIGRGDFFFAILATNIAYLVAVYMLTGGLSLTLKLGFRSEFGAWGEELLEASALKLACDFVFLSLAYRRLQDAGKPGWIALLLLILPLVLGGVGAIVSFLALIALFFLRPDIGPNRFGPDPRGWNSREHYQEGQRRLDSGDV